MFLIMFNMNQFKSYQILSLQYELIIFILHT